MNHPSEVSHPIPQTDLDRLKHLNEAIKRGEARTNFGTIITAADPPTHEMIDDMLCTALSDLRAIKTNDRTEKDRYVAMCISQIEMLIAFHYHYCVEDNR